MINKKELSILMNMRQDGRRTLTQISKNTGVPISTVYDRIRTHIDGLIHKNCCLIDFSKLGLGCRVNIVLKVKRDDRSAVKDFLLKHHSVNNVWKINNGYDFLADCVFRHVKEVEDFVERFEERYEIIENQIFYVIEELQHESFLTDPVHIDLIQQN